MDTVSEINFKSVFNSIRYHCLVLYWKYIYIYIANNTVCTSPNPMHQNSVLYCSEKCASIIANTSSVLSYSKPIWAISIVTVWLPPYFARIHPSEQTRIEILIFFPNTDWRQADSFVMKKLLCHSLEEMIIARGWLRSFFWKIAAQVGSLFNPFVFCASETSKSMKSFCVLCKVSMEFSVKLIHHLFNQLKRTCVQVC